MQVRRGCARAWRSCVVCICLQRAQEVDARAWGRHMQRAADIFEKKHGKEHPKTQESVQWVRQQFEARACVLRGSVCVRACVCGCAGVCACVRVRKPPPAAWAAATRRTPNATRAAAPPRPVLSTGEYPGVPTSTREYRWQEYP